jgi:hypothetical protein
MPAVNVSSHTLKAILPEVLSLTNHRRSIRMILMLTLLAKGILTDYQNDHIRCTIPRARGIVAGRL